MLILMRRTEESIVIGNNIEIKVLKIQGNQVHLGINAPREITVYRHEIWQQVLEENRNSISDKPISSESGGLGSLKDLIKKKK